MSDAHQRPVARMATESLLDLAEKTRPDIDRQDLHEAILTAYEASWQWRRVLKAVVQILADGEEPRDLRTAVQEPWRPRRIKHDV